MVATVVILHSMHLVDLTSDLQQYPVTQNITAASFSVGNIYFKQ